jgi:DNA-directed RNA polymerase subunit L/DNA-directed RNA polymerase alpha subunit
MSTVTATPAPLQKLIPAGASAPPKTIAEIRAAKAAIRKPAPPKPPTGSIFKAVTQEGPNVLRFVIEPTAVGYANTLRRTMITDVETIAFRADITETGTTSDVLITKNSTPLSNEMLAHRIGLIPIHVENPLDWKPEEYSFSLNVSNDSSDALDVVAGDIQVLKKRGAEEEPLIVPNVQFFHPDPVTHDTALLTVLKGKLASQEAETVQFSAVATMGTGRENAAFMPVTSRCAYGYSKDDDPERKKEIFTLWLNKHKKVNATELEANPTRKAELEREFETMEVQRCYKKDERGEPYSFDFIVESVGVLSPSYIVRRALEVLQAKVLRYASIDSGDLPESLKVRPADARMKGFDFVFQKEDHTMGNLLQTWMEQNLMNEGVEQITFVGYKVPHPLRDEMVLRVGVDSGKDVDARAAVAKAARECAQMFKNWSASWAAVSV